MVKRSIFFVLLMVATFFAQIGYGHHLWVIETDDGYMVCRGMAPGRLDSYDPACVKEFRAFGSDGTTIPSESIQRIEDPDRVRFQIPGKASLIGVSCDWGYRVNTTEGKKLLTRIEAEKAGLRVLESFFSTQFAVVLFNEGIWTGTPLGMRFELVPLRNPLHISVAGQLPVQAFFEGQPVANTAIFTEGGLAFQTDRMGVANVKIVEEGLQLLMARLKIPVRGDPQKDYHVYTTFFVYEIK
jgi:nickel transport protein